MNFKGLLDQLMSSSGDIAQQVQSQLGTDSANSGGMSDMTKGAIGGAVGGSLLTLLVGSKKGRKLGKKAVKLGGAAALGALAFKVYNDWQANQQPGQGVATAPPPVAPVPDEQRSMAVLRGMIAAAKADGHVDVEEQGRIQQAVQSLGAAPEVSAFVQQELDKPLDPAEVARGIDDQELASEVYLASVLMVDEQNFMERAYLKELATQLRLQPDLVAQLEAQVVPTT